MYWNLLTSPLSQEAKAGKHPVGLPGPSLSIYLFYFVDNLRQEGTCVTFFGVFTKKNASKRRKQRLRSIFSGGEEYAQFAKEKQYLLLI